jgi:hypothetical protein
MLTGPFSGWSREERDKRLLKFVDIAIKHIPEGRLFLLDHQAFDKFREIILQHPILRTTGEKRLFKNPYYISFMVVFGLELANQGWRWRDTGTKELIEILFDEGIDERRRLKKGYEEFVRAIRKGSHPEFLDLLINKEAEFRDDKKFLPLQAADLLAWHVRRNIYEKARGHTHDDPIWVRLMTNRHIKYKHMFYGAEELGKFLLRFTSL